MTPHITIDKDGLVCLAELPNKWKFKDYDGLLDIDEYGTAKAKALSEAIPFEDQERVAKLLPKDAFTQVSYPSGTTARELVMQPKHGTYPIPPDFPKWEKVTQMEIMDQFVQMKWIDVTSDFPKMERNKDIDPTLFRTVIRFVEEKKEEVGGYPLDHTGSYFLCSKCAGTGKNPKMSTTVSASHPDCPSCHGRGWVTKSNYE